MKFLRQCYSLRLYHYTAGTPIIVPSFDPCWNWLIFCLLQNAALGKISTSFQSVIRFFCFSHALDVVAPFTAS